MTILLDYSSARPSIQQMHAAGAAGALRYLCHGNGAKRLTSQEAHALRGAGLWIGVVFEDTADRARQGVAVGKADAIFAAAQAAQIGIPPTCPIFFAVDYDASPAEVKPYFQGCQAARISNPIGVYGSYRVVDTLTAQGIPYGWQTVAWSHGQRSARAHLLQTVEASVPGTDKNYLLKPLPLWGAPAGHEPNVKPTPQPTPTPNPAPDLETDMTVVYVPNGPTALLAAGRLVSLTSNAQVDAYKAAGVPVHHITQAQMDTLARVSASL